MDTRFFFKVSQVEHLEETSSKLEILYTEKVRRLVPESMARRHQENGGKSYEDKEFEVKREETYVKEWMEAD